MTSTLSHQKKTGNNSGPRLWARVLFLFLLSFYQVAVCATVVVKSENDQRQYQYLTLPNQLRVLLISDPTTDKAAASLDVYVGSGDDPRDRQGLAHFLEHMLFLGTKKYPEAGEYQEFVNRHGGSLNAYTSQEHTNYFFDVEAAYLEPTLDRFSQFFIAPLFTGKYVDRERNAVNSEYKAKIKDDFRRSMDVYRQVINPKHPLTKFSVGSLATLADRAGDPVREDLLNFYYRYYSADLMTLVVLGKEPLATLETLVSSRFSQVALRKSTLESAGPDQSQSQSQPPQPLFSPGFLPAKVYIKPEKDIRNLAFIFALPPTHDYYREKPLSFIGHLMGHEGKGSLLSLLKQRGWAEGLSAGTGLSDRNGATFHISISLTEKGMAHQAEIEALVFTVIGLIEDDGIDKWRFKEQQQLGEIAFRFQEKQEPMFTVNALANQLHYYAPADILRGAYLYTKYDAKLIRRLLGYLSPDKVLITLSAHSVGTDKVTEKYQAPYRVQTPYRLGKKAVAVGELAVTKKQLVLPDKNRFIPRRLEIKKVKREDGQAPVVIRESEKFRAFYKQDDTFSVPRATIIFRVKSPLAAQSAESAALTEMFVAMVKDGLNEFAYPASLAGLQFSVSVNSRGIDVQIAGYNDSQGILLTRILDAGVQATFPQDRFDSIKQELLRHWRNSHKQPPYQQLLRELPVALFQPYWKGDELAAILSQKNRGDLEQFARQLFVDSRIEMLIFGNYRHKEALQLAANVEKRLFKRAKVKRLMPSAKVVKLPTTGQSLYSRVEVDHRDTAVTLYVQGLDDNIEDKAHMTVLRQVLKPQFFHVLRTEKQLGYIVFVAGMALKDVPGSALVVQSPFASAPQLIGEINSFLQHYRQTLPQSLDQHKQAVIARLLEKPKNQRQQASLYWDNIVYGVSSFDRNQQLAAAIAQISLKSFNDYYDKVLLAPANQWWWVAGGAGGAAAAVDLTPVKAYEKFKLSQPAYSYP